MSTGGGWETVVNRKGLKNVKNPSKLPKKSSLDSMPRIQPIAPMKETPTIYQAFLEEELRKERKLLEAEKGQLSKENKKQSNHQVKKKDKRMTLKDSLETIDFSEFEAILKKDEISFPKNPEIWLKDLASLLNNKLDHIIDSDPILADKPLDYPLCLMSSLSRDFFINKLKGFNNQVYEALMEHCVDCLMNNITKDQSSLGFRLVIQLLLQDHSNVIVNNLQKYESLIQRNSSRPLRCLCILWAVGQVGNHNFSNGLKVWFSLMFGLIAVKNLNDYVLSYLENLFERNCCLEEGYNALSKTDYFKFFGELYSELSTLPCGIKKRLQLLYPNIKAIAWGDVSNNLNVYFIGYLSRLMPDCHESKKAELLECLVACLEKDSKSFIQWKKEYHKNMNQSSLLLNHLESNIERFNFDRSLLIDAVKAFQIINDDLTQRLPSKHSFLKSSNASCKAILLHKKRKSGVIKPFFMLSVLLAAVILGDIYSHGSLEASFSHNCLAQIRSIPTVDLVVNKCSSIFSSLGATVIENLDRLSKSVEQLLENPLVAGYVTRSKHFLEEIVQVLSEKVATYTPKLMQQLDILAKFSVDSFMAMLEACRALHTFCSENVFVGALSPENIKNEISHILHVLQDGISNLYTKSNSQ